MTWSDYLLLLEDWVRRADDPEAVVPGDPVGVPTPDELLRARALLAAMERREVALNTERRELAAHAAYS